MELINYAKEVFSVTATLISTAEADQDLQDNVMDKHGNRVPIIRAMENHLVVLDKLPMFYTEAYASRVWRLNKIPSDSIDDCIACIKQLAKDSETEHALTITEINGQPATQCGLADSFLRNGFVRDGQKLVLSPT